MVSAVISPRPSSIAPTMSLSRSTRNWTGPSMPNRPRNVCWVTVHSDGGPTRTLRRSSITAMPSTIEMAASRTNARTREPAAARIALGVELGPVDPEQHEQAEREGRRDRLALDHVEGHAGDEQDHDRAPGPPLAPAQRVREQQQQDARDHGGGGRGVAERAGDDVVVEIEVLAQAVGQARGDVDDRDQVRRETDPARQPGRVDPGGRPRGCASVSARLTGPARGAGSWPLPSSPDRAAARGLLT